MKDAKKTGSEKNGVFKFESCKPILNIFDWRLPVLELWTSNIMLGKKMTDDELKALVASRVGRNKAFRANARTSVSGKLPETPPRATLGWSYSGLPGYPNPVAMAGTYKVSAIYFRRDKKKGLIINTVATHLSRDKKF